MATKASGEETELKKLNEKEILNAKGYLMHNQSDDLDLDIQNLFIDESDVDGSVELEERLRQSKALQWYSKYWLDAL